MKTFGLWLKMAGLCLMFALAFPACSDDDEEKEEPGGVELSLIHISSPRDQR